MSDVFVDARSVWRGLCAMTPERSQAKWAVKWFPKRCWIHAWTPVWHNGRGPYLTCGIYILAIYRGF